MKKFLTLLLALSLFLISAFFVSCGKTDKNDGDAPTLSVVAPDGAPALALASFINGKEDFGTNADMNYKVVSSANIADFMRDGTGDIIVMPINAASKLYSVKKYKMAAVVTHGNLYIMAKENLSLNDLVGKVVGVINIANVPGLTFKAILEANEIDYEESDTAINGKVALKGYSDGSELIPALRQNKVSVGLLPEPAANRLTALDSSFKYALDLQELYNESAAYPQAVMMVKEDIIAKYPDLIKNISEKFNGGVSWLKENPESAVTAIESVLVEGVTPSFTAENLNGKVIDNCKIYWESGEAAKNSVKDYLNKIIGINQASANAVSDDFFA